MAKNFYRILLTVSSSLYMESKSVFGSCKVMAYFAIKDRRGDGASIDLPRQVDGFGLAVMEMRVIAQSELTLSKEITVKHFTEPEAHVRFRRVRNSNVFK